MRRFAQIAIAIGFGSVLLEVYVLMKMHYVFEFRDMHLLTLLLPVGALYLLLFDRKSEKKK